MTWLDEEEMLKEQLDQIDVSGYAFELIGTHVQPQRQLKTKIVPPPPPCNAPDAFAGFSYTGCFTEAERRLKAGAHQARCLTCMRYRWADEPCDAAVFKGEKGPRPERVNS
jgi:hypothetical protein